jgi:hypothetical protein
MGMASIGMQMALFSKAAIRMAILSAKVCGGVEIE